MNQLSTSTDPVPMAWVEKIFEKMVSTYGVKFLDNYRDIDLQAVKLNWAKGLGELTREEIIRGVNLLKETDWPPMLPQFIKLCKVKINPDAAYYEAINGIAARDRGEIGDWTHPAIYWAMVQVGAFDLKTQGYSAIKGRWENVLEQQMAKGNWSAIPEPMIALPPPPNGVSKEVAERYIAETQVIKKESSAVDHRQWAKLIMERHAAGDKTLSHIQINFAKEALASAVH